MGLDTKTYWLTDRQLQCDFDFDLNLESDRISSEQLQVSRKLEEWVQKNF
jgi:hypothetical protein